MLVDVDGIRVLRFIDPTTGFVDAKNREELYTKLLAFLDKNTGRRP